jgi:hypothetical protein
MGADRSRRFLGRCDRTWPPATGFAAPPIHVMVPGACQTTPAEALNWREFDLYNQAPATGTRSVSVRSTGLELSQGGRSLRRSAQNVVINRETEPNLQKINGFARLWQTSQRRVMWTEVRGQPSAMLGESCPWTESGPAAPFALRLLATAGPSSSPAHRTRTRRTTGWSSPGCAAPFFKIDPPCARGYKG